MSEPQLVPLNAIFATDFVQILVPVTTANTMARGRRRGRPPRRGQAGPALPYDKVVIYQGERLPAEMTVAAAGIKPLDHVTVEYDIPEAIMKNPVGPVLRMGDEVEQIIAAIEDDNPAPTSRSSTAAPTSGCRARTRSR